MSEQNRERVAIITGASRGIGQASAEAFSRSGWRVLALSRSACPVEGVNSLAVDLGDPSLEVDAKIDAWLRAELGEEPGVRCLVHNAATLISDGAMAVDPDQLRTVLELNVVAPTRLNRVARPHLGPGSSVLYVGSTLGVKAVAGVASYVMSKHAVVGLMRSTCQDLAGTGVHTACVCPGFTRTEMLVDRAGGDESILASLGELSTFGRLIEPEEIADLLRFAAEHPVINGSVLHGNLGQVER